MSAKLPQNKVRSKEVDDEIERQFRLGTMIFMIARIVPIGERSVRKCLKERGLLPSKQKSQTASA